MKNQRLNRSPGRPKLTEADKPTGEIILHAATSLFLRNGLQKVSVDDIAKEAGVTKASVYYYFETKAELFKESMVALMNRVRERTILLLGSDKPLYERLSEIVLAHLQSTATIDLEGFMREAKTSLTDEQMEKMRLAEESIYICMEEAFLKAIETKEIPSINTKFAAHAFIALVKAGNYKQTDGSSFFSTIEETADYILNIFWRGFFGDEFSRKEK